MSPSLPVRVQLSRRNGWRKPANTRVVTRATRYGNPWKVVGPNIQPGSREVETRAQAVKEFDDYLHLIPTGIALAARAKRELRGMNLACFCPLDGPCHADVLLKIANE